jgi:Uma2 family endonuclease
MASPSPLKTVDDLWALPENGRFFELVKGELRSTGPNGFEHGCVVTNVAYALRSETPKTVGVVLLGRVGFVLEREPDRVLGPDIAFIKAERFDEARLPEKYFEGPPDLAIEVVSPEDRDAEVDAKAHDYIAAGAALVWVINPRWRNVTIYQADRTVRVVAETEALTAPDLLPGFTCQVADMFPKPTT